jgi:hypothetical protein
MYKQQNQKYNEARYRRLGKDESTTAENKDIDSL